MALAAIVFGLMICVLHGKQLPQFFATQACSTNLTKVGDNASGSKSYCLFGHNITQDDEICSTHLRSMRKDSMLPCYVCKLGVTAKTRKSAVNLECFTGCHSECDKKNHFAHDACYKNSEKKRPAPSAVPAYSNHGGGTMRGDCDAYGGGAIRGDSDGDTMRGDDVDCALEEQAQKTQEKMGNMLRFARLFQGAVAQPQHALSLPPPEDSAAWLTSLASVAISTLRNGSLQSAASNITPQVFSSLTGFASASSRIRTRELWIYREHKCLRKRGCCTRWRMRSPLQQAKSKKINETSSAYKRNNSSTRSTKTLFTQHYFGVTLSDLRR